MALFKVFRGTSSNLPAEIHDGYAYLTTDDGKFYIDTASKRILINPDIDVPSDAEDIDYSNVSLGNVSNVKQALDQIINNISNSADILYNTVVGWGQVASTTISKRKTIYVYTDATENNPRIKIGDGSTYLVDLPFLDAIYWDHIHDNEIHTTLEEKRIWHEKINCEYKNSETLKFFNSMDFFNQNYN